MEEQATPAETPEEPQKRAGIRRLSVDDQYRRHREGVSKPARDGEENQQLCRPLSEPESGSKGLLHVAE